MCLFLFIAHPPACRCCLLSEGKVLQRQEVTSPTTKTRRVAQVGLQKAQVGVAASVPASAVEVLQRNARSSGLWPGHIQLSHNELRGGCQCLPHCTENR